MPDPQIPPMNEAAVDLSKVAERAAAAKAAEERAAQEAAVRQIQAWDRAMQRAFKGIMPRPTRHRFLMQDVDAGE